MSEIATLLAPKARSAVRRLGSGSIGRAFALGFIGLMAWALLFALCYRLLVYFRGAEGIGDLLAGKLLSLMFLAFLSILLLSNVITALSTFFLAKDLELVEAAPLDHLSVYVARLVETLVHSSWMVVLVAIPMLAAYGLVYDGGITFVVVSTVAVGALLVLMAVLGSALTLLLVNLFPARRTRDLLALITLIATGIVVLMVRLLRPERLASPDGFRDLVHFMAELRSPRSPWLPSDWAADAVMYTLEAGTATDLFPLLLLVSTAATAVVAGSWLHARLFEQGFTRAQEGAELRSRAARPSTVGRFASGVAPVTVRALVAKDVRTFFRDSTQWSQLLLLGMLVVVYVYNIRVLPLRTGEDVGFFLRNVVSFLNLALGGFVLAAVAARFLFPAVSLEGRTLWLLRSSPLDLRTLVWSKFWVGAVPLLVLAIAITVATNAILQVGPFMMVLSVTAITVMSFVIAALALGFGAVFPRFDTENAAQIPTGFGGLLFMFAATGYLVVLIMALAVPVYAVLQARFQGQPIEPAQYAWLAAGFALAAAVSAAGIAVPLRIAIQRVTMLES
ncbi:MAG TPA: hypothetical protein VNZ57_09250 [Longimicrobiales bacterium]|nr:hypothetical protein [Longimicrobiales bacterium]